MARPGDARPRPSLARMDIASCSSATFLRQARGLSRKPRAGLLDLGTKILGDTVKHPVLGFLPGWAPARLRRMIDVAELLLDTSGIGGANVDLGKALAVLLGFPRLSARQPLADDDGLGIVPFTTGRFTFPRIADRLSPFQKHPVQRVPLRRLRQLSQRVLQVA